MIAFLTLCYCAIVWLLSYKLKLIKPTTGVKSAYAGVYVVFLLAILIALNMYAPISRDVRIYRRTVPIAARVPGIVTDVPVRANQLLQEGDVLFQVQQDIYEARVRDLEARLSEAEQAVPQLKESWEQAKAQHESALANRRFAQLDLERLSQAGETSAVSQNEIDRAQSQLDSSAAQVVATLAAAEQARMRYESRIDGENTTVAALRAQLEGARLDLRDSTVRAPSAGYVTNLQLRVGTMAAATSNPLMTFVPDENPILLVTLGTNQVRHLQVGDRVEISLPQFPGHILAGEVGQVIPMTGEGQLPVSGTMPETTAIPPSRVFVVVRSEEELPGVPVAGSGGTAAFYSEYGGVVQIVSKIVVRIDAWMNYL